MPAVNPRIAVYLPKHVASTVARLAGLRGVSRSAVIRDFLIEAEPVLQRIANLLDLAARTDRTALKDWAVTLEQEQGRMERTATEAFAQLDALAADMEAKGVARKPNREERRRTRRPQGARPPRTPGQ